MIAVPATSHLHRTWGTGMEAGSYYLQMEHITRKPNKNKKERERESPPVAEVQVTSEISLILLGKFNVFHFQSEELKNVKSKLLHLEWIN